MPKPCIQFHCLHFLERRCYQLFPVIITYHILSPYCRLRQTMDPVILVLSANGSHSRVERVGSRHDLGPDIVAAAVALLLLQLLLLVFVGRLLFAVCCFLFGCCSRWLLLLLCLRCLMLFAAVILLAILCFPTFPPAFLLVRCLSCCRTVVVVILC